MAPPPYPPPRAQSILKEHFERAYDTLRTLTQIQNAGRNVTQETEVRTRLISFFGWTFSEAFSPRAQSLQVLFPAAPAAES